MAAQTPAQLEQLRQRYRKPMFVSLGIAAAIWILPFKPTAPNNSFRLLLTIGFFAAAIYGISRLLQPRERYAIELFKRRYANAPPQIELLAKKVCVREQHAFRTLAIIGIACLSCGAVGVLSCWPQFAFLSPARGIATLGFIGGILGLGFFVGSSRSGWAGYAEARHALREMTETSDFKPTDPAAEITALAHDDKPVAATRNGFRAGGYEWRWDDFHKNAIVFGQPGSGKTVCVLNALLDGLLVSDRQSTQPAGGLVLDPKGDFRDKIQSVLRRQGREADLMVLDPAALNHTIYWNPFDSNDDELELASRFASVLEILGTKNTQDTFWIDSARKFLRHAIGLLRHVNPADQPPSFREIAQLAASLDNINTRLEQLPVDDPEADIEACLDFFEEWSQLGDKTRSSVQAQLTNMIDPFLMQPYRAVFGGRSTARIGEMLDRGRILYVHMPIADKQAMSRTICTLVKLEYFREVLKRVDKPRQSFFLCDEFQVFMTVGMGRGDADFFERSRQSRHANIIACQNMPALLKQTDQEKAVVNLLSNCAIKIFLRNTDPHTNEYGANLFGQRLVESASTSLTSGQGLRRRGESRNISISSEYDYVIRPEAFTKLAIPVAGERDSCESIVHLGSRAEVRTERLTWKVHPL